MKQQTYENKAGLDRVIMRYVGGRIPGVPARDLTESDLRKLEDEFPEVDDLEIALERSGFYKRVAVATKESE